MTNPARESPSYQLFMLALCVCTLVALIANAVVQEQNEVKRLIMYADTAVCAIFFADFLVSLYRAENRLRYFYTWGWIDLVSSIPLVDAARWGRLARIARIFRGVRAARMIGVAILERRAQSTFLAAALVALLVLIVTSVTMLNVETVPESNIRTAEDALWWALTTITTVGYGDLYPVTTEGRLVAGALMCVGVGLFGMFSGFLAAWFVAPGNRQERGDIDALKTEIAQLRAAIEQMSVARTGAADGVHMKGIEGIEDMEKSKRKEDPKTRS